MRGGDSPRRFGDGDLTQVPSRRNRCPLSLVASISRWRPKPVPRTFGPGPVLVTRTLRLFSAGKVRIPCLMCCRFARCVIA